MFPRGESVAVILVIGATALLSGIPAAPGAAGRSGGGGRTRFQASPIPAGGALTLGSHAGSVLLGLTLTPRNRGPTR